MKNPTQGWIHPYRTMHRINTPLIERRAGFRVWSLLFLVSHLYRHCTPLTTIPSPLLPPPPSPCQSAKAWCPSCCFLGAGDSSDDNGDGFNHGLAKIKYELEANAEPAPAKETGRKKQSSWMEREVLQQCDIRKPSWMQAEMTPSTTRERNGPSQDSLTLGHETKPEKLLAQGHIRILVFINAMYSVCLCLCDWCFTHTSSVQFYV